MICVFHWKGETDNRCIIYLCTSKYHGIHFACKYIPNYVHIQVHIAHFDGFSIEKNLSSLIKMVIKAHLKMEKKPTKKTAILVTCYLPLQWKAFHSALHGWGTFSVAKDSEWDFFWCDGYCSYSRRKSRPTSSIAMNHNVFGVYTFRCLVLNRMMMLMIHCTCIWFALQSTTFYMYVYQLKLHAY